MSEHVLKVFLEDMKIIRICCMKCGGIAEWSVESLGTTAPTQQCSFCREPLLLSIDQTHSAHPVTELATALAHLRSIASKVRIEFPVKVEEKS